MSVELHPNPARIWKAWRVLCEDIGERRAGTAGERKAAEFILKSFQEAGLQGGHIEDFKCKSLRSVKVTVEIQENNVWRAVESRALVGAPSTPGGRPVEGDLVWLALPEDGPRLKPKSLAGKILMLFGPLPTAVELHKKLVAAEPAAVIHIDERLPFAWAKNDGVFPEWSRKFGVPVTVTVPYTEAWRWRQSELTRARVAVHADLVDGVSQNVVAELPGTHPKAGAIVLGCHHDTQCNNVGADDNGSGVMSLLELARLLAPLKLRRTLRFISFGTEEQLSVGSCAYVKAHRAQLKKIDCVVNFDSLSSPLGHVELVRAGGADLEKYALGFLAKRDLYVAPNAQVVPFADHFCFSVFGIPGLWFWRSNCAGGRWQHHSAHDNLSNVSTTELARILGPAGELIADLADSAKLPFARKLDPAQTKTTKEWAKTLFGL
ncbi:MAG: M28 family metallopeptidase [Planctomycetota bacterium]